MNTSLNIPGPPGFGYLEGFRYKGQIVTPNFNTGSGWEYPLDSSLPWAQLFRYAFTVKRWRIQSSLVQTQVAVDGDFTSTTITTETLDTGLIPYPFGWNGEQAVATLNFQIGDQSISAIPQNRVGQAIADVNFLASTEISYSDSSGESSTDEGESIINLTFMTSADVRPPGGLGSGSSTLIFLPKYVIDEDNPGKAFLQFRLQDPLGLASNGQSLNYQGSAGAEYVGSGVSVILDGLDIPLWTNIPAVDTEEGEITTTTTWGGNITITTSDEE